MTDLNGVLVVDKPMGWTSHDVVNKTRYMLKVKKVGHTGTLDPMATGVLVLLIGTATKAAPLFENDRKRYFAKITFGHSTDTYDAEGMMVATGDPSLVDIDNLRTIIDSMHGEFEQQPPMFSAVKVGGRRLYHIARSGGEVKRKSRRIRIFSISADVNSYPVVTIDIECSKGTYIRSIAQELGGKAGCPAHLSALRRTASGQFAIEDAVPFKTIVDSNDHEALEKAIRPLPVGGNL